MVGVHSDIANLDELLISPSAAVGFDDANSDAFHFRFAIDGEEAPLAVAPIDATSYDQRLPFVVIADASQNVEVPRRAAA